MAQFASNKAIANTPHSPQFNISLSQSKVVVNTNSQNLDQSLFDKQGKKKGYLKSKKKHC